MYQELFSVSYQHEYFELPNTIDFDVALSENTKKLSQAMDALIRPYYGGFRFFCNSAQHAKEELLEIFGDEYLTFYLSPKNKEVFYYVTEGLGSVYHYKKNIYPEESIQDNQKDGQVDKKCPLFIMFASDKLDVNEQLQASSEPIDKLLMIHSLDQLFQLSDIDITHVGDVKKKDDSIKEIYALSKKIPLILLILPLAKLLTSKSHLNIKLIFFSKSAFYKYYFTNIDPDERLKIMVDNNDADMDHKAEIVDYISTSERLDGDKPIQVFTSTKPVKLKYDQKHHYRLILENNDRKQTLIERLPQPKLDQYFKHIDSQNNPAIVLESFIN